jgi:hypothetical protein
MSKPSEKKYQDAADPTVFALVLQKNFSHALLIHAYNSLTEESSLRQDE